MGIMKFRLNDETDCISLEAFLKAVGVNDDYQQIRFMVKDGEVSVNGEQEIHRRRMLEVGDTVTFYDKEYLITAHLHREKPIRKNKRVGFDKRDYEDEQIEFVRHKQEPLKWSEKKIKKKEKYDRDAE